MMPFRLIIIAALQSAGLYAAGFLIPLLGQVAVLFVPVPLIVLTVREGRGPGYLALGLASLFIAAMSSWQMSVLLFFLGFGLMAAGLSEGILRNRKAEQAVFIGGALPVAALAVGLSFLLLKTGKDPIPMAEAYLRGTITDAREVYSKLGLGEVAQTLDQVSDRIIHYVVRLLPGILLSASLMQAASCYGLTRTIILRRNPGSPIASQPSLAAWHAPDSLVWGLIGTLVLIAWGLIDQTQTRAFLLGLNLACVYGLLYMVQGLSLIEYAFLRARIPAVWRVVLFMLLFALPAVVLIIPLGIVDIWADFRKVRRPPAQA
jgi:uncharacterized protein YybS (DUF2232 family)